MELKIGDRAPEFTLPDADGQQVSLRDFRGRTVVLYFYPKDDTPGCTREACDFRDAGKDFSRLKAVILGVSKDSEDSHRRFIRKFDLMKYRVPFHLLSDPALQAIKAYGVWGKKKILGHAFQGVQRTTFVIDPQGRIQKIYPRVRASGHVAAVLADLKTEAES